MNSDCNVTDHPTAEWTRQQFREFLDGESNHRYLIHDRDSVFSVEVDGAVKGLGVRVLKTPVRSPMATAYGERVIGSIRRECLDYLIPLNERHLKRILVFRNRLRQLSLPVAIDIDYLRPSRCTDARTRRLTSRISPGEGGCITASNILAVMNSTGRTKPRS